MWDLIHDWLPGFLKWLYSNRCHCMRYGPNEHELPMYSWFWLIHVYVCAFSSVPCCWARKKRPRSLPLRGWRRRWSNNPNQNPRNGGKTVDMLFFLDLCYCVISCYICIFYNGLSLYLIFCSKLGGDGWGCKVQEKCVSSFRIFLSLAKMYQVSYLISRKVDKTHIQIKHIIGCCVKCNVDMLKLHSSFMLFSFFLIATWDNLRIPVLKNKNNVASNYNGIMRDHCILCDCKCRNFVFT